MITAASHAAKHATWSSDVFAVIIAAGILVAAYLGYVAACNRWVKPPENSSDGDGGEP